MSCDNLPGNGEVTENAVTGLAALVDPGLAQWIRANVAFPNGMVDRITPATSERERAIVAEQAYGIVDARPVFCEAFAQWVLEDTLPVRAAGARGGRRAVRRATCARSSS